jgi:hypothetical protein
MEKRRIVVGIVAAVLTVGILCGQSTAIPTWWFTAAPKAVLADSLFPTLPLTTRRQILSQIDPKFSKMKAEEQDRFLWHAETDYLPKAAGPKQTITWNPADSSSELLEVGWISSAIVQQHWRDFHSFTRTSGLKMARRILYWSGRRYSSSMF